MRTHLRVRGVTWWRGASEYCQWCQLASEQLLNRPPSQLAKNRVEACECKVGLAQWSAVALMRQGHCLSWVVSGLGWSSLIGKSPETRFGEAG